MKKPRKLREPDLLMAEVMRDLGPDAINAEVLDEAARRHPRFFDRKDGTDRKRISYLRGLTGAPVVVAPNGMLFRFPDQDALNSLVKTVGEQVAEAR